MNLINGIKLISLILVEKILPGLELERKLVKGAIKTITELGTNTTKSHAKHLDKEFYNTVKEFVDKKEDPHANRIYKIIIKNYIKLSYSSTFNNT